MLGRMAKKVGTEMGDRNKRKEESASKEWWTRIQQPSIITRQLEYPDCAAYKVMVVVGRSAYIEDDVANSKAAHLRSEGFAAPELVVR